MSYNVLYSKMENLLLFNSSILLNLFVIATFIFLLSFVLPMLFIRGDKNELAGLQRTCLMIGGFGEVLFVILSLAILYTGQTLNFTLYTLSTASPELEFSFTIDKLSAFFIFLISIVSLSVTIYSTKYIEHYPYPSRNAILVALMNIFILSMILVVLSANTFSFLFFWEIMSLTSFFMVMYDYEKEESRKAGMFYFVMTQLSTVFLFIGFFLLYLNTGSFDIKQSGIEPSSASAIFLALFIGFSIKAGVVPVHKWLPYAHGSAPSNISALMSGVMLKVAIYGLIRFLITVINPELWWGIIILIFGTISAILGVIYALKEHDIKRLLAYHSIENIGIILIAFGMYVIFSAKGMEELAILCLLAALFHTLNHAIFKSLLFLTAGSIVAAIGTKNIELMGGLVKKMPYTALLFFIGAASISALPPLNGFVSELMIFLAFIQSYNLNDPLLQVLFIVSLSLFALTSALAAACFVKAFGIMFLAAPRSKRAENASEMEFPMLAGPAILAVLCIVLGLFSYQIFHYFNYNINIPDMSLIGIALFILSIIVFAVIRLTASKKTRVCETWGCGIISQNSKMEYTASGFSYPIEFFFDPVYRTKEINKRKFFDAKHSIFKVGFAEIEIAKVFEERIYMPVAKTFFKISSLVDKFHNGNTNTYLFYTFVTVVIILIILKWLI